MLSFINYYRNYFFPKNNQKWNVIIIENYNLNTKFIKRDKIHSTTEQHKKKRKKTKV